MALGDSWWSTMAVVPFSSASRAPSIADQRIISRSSAVSSRHHTCSRISWKLVGDLRWRRHAPRQRGVEMVVGTDEARGDCGHGATSRRVRHVRHCRGDARHDALRYPPPPFGSPTRRSAGYRMRSTVDKGAIGREGRRPGRARTRPGAMPADVDLTTPPAGGGLIGNRLRQTPSTSWNAAATAPAVGTSPISPTPLTPYGELRLRRLDEDHLDVRHVLGPQDAEAAQRHVGGRPSSSVGKSSVRAYPRPMWTAPSICPSHSIGLTARPTSWAATTFSMAPVALIGDDELGGVAERRVDDRILEALLERVGPVDAVLAVRSRRRASMPASLATRQASATEPAPMSVPPRSGGLARAELAGRVDDDAHLLGFNAELLDRHLERDRVDALAHLRPAVADLDGAVVVEPNDGLGDLDEAVAEARVLEAEARGRPPCRRRAAAS